MKKLSVLIFALLCTACAPQSDGRQTLSLAGTAQIAQAGTLISLQRADAGVPAPIVQNGALQAAAQAHADDLSATGQFSHRSSNGDRLMDRIAASGYTACFAAENIAQGQLNVNAVIASWAQSRGHYENMVNAAAQQFGFAKSGDVWVLVLARPC